MKEFMNNLPSFGQMFKLIIFLVLALIVVGLLAAIVKALMPVLVLGVIVIGGLYLYNKWQQGQSHA